MLSKHFDLLSVAPYFGQLDHEQDQTEHWTAYQLELQRASMAFGHSFTILSGPNSHRGNSNIRPMLEGDSVNQVANGVKEYIENVSSTKRPHVVLLYEGNLAYVAALTALAKKHPHCNFVVNLFTAECGLALPGPYNEFRFRPQVGILRERHRISTLSWRSAEPSLPDNLYVLADTQERFFLAKAMGINVRGVWRNHSQIAHIYGEQAGSHESSERVRILVPLSFWQLSERLIEHLISVKLYVSAVCSPCVNYEWTLSGWFTPGRESRRWCQILRDRGFVVQSKSRSREEYAALFRCHDAVWFPVRGYYATQSSGKVLDALVQGAAIVAPHGSYGAREQQRWVPGAPAYSSTREAVELMRHLPNILREQRKTLHQENDVIRSYYSPESSIQNILDTITCETSKDVSSHGPWGCRSGEERESELSSSTFHMNNATWRTSPESAVCTAPKSKLVLIRSVLAAVKLSCLLLSVAIKLRVSRLLRL